MGSQISESHPQRSFMDTDGFFLCGHCHRVVELSPVEIEAAEQSPEGRLVDLQCPRCGWNDVSWRPISARRPKTVPAEQRPVTDARAAELFAQVRRALNIL